MRRISILIVLLLTAAITFACGNEKKEESSAADQPLEQLLHGESSPEFAWESLPNFPEAILTNARMMPGNRGYEKFETHLFTAEDDARSILDFYKKELPEEDWTFAEETKLDNGLQGSWEAKKVPATLWVRATQSKTTEGTQIEIIYGKKK